MRAIALVAVTAILLLDFADATPKSSVGGPLTMLLISLLAMLALGLYEAWSQKRGVLGWIVSIVASFVGGSAGIIAGGMVMEVMIPYLNLEGSLAASRHPMRYVSSAGMILLTLLGSWIALQIVNRLR